MGGCWEDAHWGFPAPSKHSPAPQPTSCPPGPESNTGPPPQLGIFPCLPLGALARHQTARRLQPAHHLGTACLGMGCLGEGEQRARTWVSLLSQPPRLFPSMPDSKRNVLIGITSSLNVETHTQVYPHKCRKFIHTHLDQHTYTQKNSHTKIYTCTPKHLHMCAQSHT